MKPSRRPIYKARALTLLDTGAGDVLFPRLPPRVGRGMWGKYCATEDVAACRWTWGLPLNPGQRHPTPASVEPSPQSRTPARSEPNGMTYDFGTLGPTTAVDIPNESESAPHFFGDVAYKELNKLREQRVYPRRDAGLPPITRLPAMGQIER